MGYKMIKSKEELVSKIKQMARDLENRAEDIAVDWNKQIKRINFYADIEPENITEWDITKEYLVLPKRIDMKLDYNKESAVTMLNNGFDEIVLPAKLVIEDKEYYCWCTVNRFNKKTIKLENEVFDKEYVRSIFNQTNEFYVNDSKYYIANYEFNYKSDEEIYVDKLTFIEY